MNIIKNKSAEPKFTVFLIFILSFHCAKVSGQRIEWALEGTITNEPFHNGLAIFKENNLYGAINTSGEVAIPAQFDYLRAFHNGMALATKNNLRGIISKAGHWILPPVYKYINQNEEYNFFEVTDTAGCKGVFYNGQFVIPMGKYKYLSDYNWPFCSVTELDGKSYHINTRTGDKIVNGNSIDNIYVIRKGESLMIYDKNTGEQLDETKFLKSSKGVEIFKGEKDQFGMDLYGFRNSMTGNILITPKYHVQTLPIWINDVMHIFGSDGQEIVDCNGCIVLSNNDDTMYSKQGNYIQGLKIIGDKQIHSLYTLQGKILIPPQEEGILLIKGTSDWFMDGKSKIFDASNQERYIGHFHSSSEDMLKMEKTDSKTGKSIYYFVDVKLHKEVPGEYTKATDFSDGVAYVEQGGSHFIIDKRGKKILTIPSEYECYDGFSEGVLGVRDRSCYPYTNGYIYNPLGHEGYTYHTSENMKVDDAVYAKWMKQGKDNFDKKKWSIAKDYFYRLAMNNPENVEALTYYGACLNNMGYYEEAVEAYDMVLDIDPLFSMAEEWKETALGNINNKKRSEERSERVAEKSNMFWNALGSFSNMLGAMSSVMNSAGNSYYTPDMSLSRNSSSSTSGANGGNYQQQYQRWESLAERHYNSLTNLGYRSKNSSGSRSGGTLHSMNGGTYVQMKKSLREAQREMARIRREAASHGVTIQQSKWETAMVNY